MINTLVTKRCRNKRNFATSNLRKSTEFNIPDTKSTTTGRKCYMQAGQTLQKEQRRSVEIMLAIKQHKSPLPNKKEPYMTKIVISKYPETKGATQKSSVKCYWHHQQVKVVGFLSTLHLSHYLHREHLPQDGRVERNQPVALAILAKKVNDIRNLVTIKYSCQ